MEKCRFASATPKMQNFDKNAYRIIVNNEMPSKSLNKQCNALDEKNINAKKAF